MGKSVRSNTGEDMGRIVDIIVAGNGKVRAAIIDFGGFLGVGSRKIAVDWHALKFSADGKMGIVTLALSRNQVRISPEYKPGEPIVVLGGGTTEAEKAPPAAPAPAVATPAAVAPAPAVAAPAPAAAVPTPPVVVPAAAAAPVPAAPVAASAAPAPAPAPVPVADPPPPIATKPAQ
jgi:hypothetical protein